ncbi:carbohydrate binding domain-containing protein [Microbacterium sp. I2]|uniref:carbohydrate binding domain-containing protein n=1 Tax=Microbacterium sp. I2 TaxID=3391826 RepID=UPI003ED91976
MTRGRTRLSLTVVAATAALLAGPLLPAAAIAAEPIVVLSSDFETSADPWTGRGATIATTDAAAHSGTQSLAITGRTSNWNGAADGGLFQPGSSTRCRRGCACSTRRGPRRE